MSEQEDKRPSLYDLWMTYKFQPHTLAILVEVPDETINAMICNIPVKRDVAKKVLEQLSTLIHQECTLETVYVDLTEKHRENTSEVARLLAAIDTEYDAARAALHGLAQGTAQHKTITQRQENIAKHFEALSKVADESTVLEIMAKLGGA